MYFEVFGLLDNWRHLIVFQGITIPTLSSLYEIKYNVEVPTVELDFLNLILLPPLNEGT